MSATDTVNIVPGVSMYSVLSRLNYKPWFALAEFVDNAVQSMLEHHEGLIALHGSDYKLIVTIDISNQDGGNIRIRDNAAGIRRADFPRAFRAAQVPPDTSGLSEFGMGMKSASCWFSRSWTVRTSALNEINAHTIRFDLANIVEEQVEELDILSSSASTADHFTEVSLIGLHKPIAPRTLGKIKQHLTDIYRVLTRRGQLELRLNGEVLRYDMPAILEAPYFRDPDGENQQWTKGIEFAFGEGLQVSGFAALREVGSNSNAGFSLFRRGRVIEGSGDEGYRPSFIFGPGNSFKSQRLFGELHLSGFDVSHTKDGFQWGDSEHEFLAILAEQLDAEPVPLLRQAQGFRKLEYTRSFERNAENAVANTANTLQTHLPTAIKQLGATSPAASEDIAKGLPAEHQRRVVFAFDQRTWDVEIDVVGDTADSAWFSRILDIDQPGIVRVSVRLNAYHPFLVRFGHRDSESLEVILRMAVASVVSEVLARQAGVAMAGVVARNMNEVLTRALSNP